MRTVAEALAREGVDTTMRCLADLPLPALGLGPAPPEAAELLGLLDEADGLVVGSPEYHAAPSGGLKNVIDHFGKDLVKGKPVGLVAVCGSPGGGTNTLNTLRLVFRALHAPVLVEQAIVTEADFEEELVAAPRALGYLQSVAAGMVRELRRG